MTETELRFDDRVAVVTGAGRGIGRAHAMLLASRGAKVVVADLGGDLAGGGGSAGPAEEVVAEITAAGGEAVAAAANVAEEAGAASIVQAALDTWGRLHIVVNNAGIHDPGLFEDLSLQQFRRMVDVHYLGAMLVAKAAWPHLAKAGYGRIVNTCSEAMLGGLPQLTSYGAAKGAVFGLTRNLATEGGPLGIKVNAVAPRAYTRMSAPESERIGATFGLSPADMEVVNASMPPELCSPGMAYLAHESCVLTGEVLQVGMGAVTRVVVVQTQGLTKDGMTPEDVAANIDQILDVTGANIPSSALMGT